MNKLEEAEQVSSVLLVGGTHGNELTGIHLVQHFQKKQIEKEQISFSLNYLIANPKAIKENKRYLDKDLNRCFKSSELADPSMVNYEQTRAKEINKLYGPKGNSKIDFIIDLHTSTANMQTNIVLTRIDPFHLQLAAFLKIRVPDVVITSESELMDDHHFLESIAPKGIVIEVGPIPQGCIEYPCFDSTQKAVLGCFDFVEGFNKNSLNDLPDELEIMSYHAKIHFPTDEMGNISASIHPDLIGKSYPKIAKGDPLFKSFSGEEIYYQGESTNLAFINEAAYYDQKIALCLCRPKKYSLKSCKPVEQK